ncbi:CRISPR-associated endonuclease Cas2 [Shewanella sp. 4t3-1-2LB]|uniref:CRISPR-associated endonuclease Cas2 n=1 Tax=Shewanella sp. 4t3-1-2LB TaxID=2817682 RepID=UPI001A98FFDA|nr:CRISPR-associated endonuclease Cas2 [Shewanella sp. 4t3-1-2LB]MBO1270816.1 CRISPR-associated endonuclease Cas2 [Shewanella sp. 4t3-1-2LB]
MVNKPLWLLSYDISSPKRWRKIHRCIGSFAWPLQKSVFVAALTPVQRRALCGELAELLEPAEDALLCLPFDTPPGSFHWHPSSDIIILPDDERLQGFIN